MSKINFAPEPIRLHSSRTPEKVDIRLTTPERNFGCVGQAREINAIYEDTPHHNVIWQPDVYAEARTIADAGGIRHIIDVGCGNGEKLVHFFPETEFHTTGLDFHGSLEIVSRTFPTRRWLECDLTSNEELFGVSHALDTGEPVLLMLSDVIEHLPDPRPLIARLRSVLMLHGQNRLIISTPDRSRLGYEDRDGQPENDAHLREWTIDELVSYCHAAGFQIVRCGHTRANQFDEMYSTIFVELACSRDHYIAFLNRAGLLHGRSLPRQLLVTSEYAGLHNTGGIGTFVAEQRLTYGMDNTVCLFAGQDGGLLPEDFQRHRLVVPSVLLDEVDMTLPTEDIILKAALQLLFYFPDIEKIEYADYQGLGCRLAQAKRAGMFPQWVELIVHCHGATHYLENANQTWYGGTHFGVAEREKISIENADRVVFPTAFLLDLYRDVGIAVPHDKVVLLRYPYHAEPVEITSTRRVDTLVFFGKRSAMKGYGLFLEAAADDGELLRGRGIKRIVFVGPRVNGSLEDSARLQRLRGLFEVVEMTSLSRAAAMNAVRDYADHSLCVMPYLGDNHPFALLDVTFAGALPVMVRAGGVVELFPAPFGEMLLADAAPAALLDKMLALIDQPAQDRHQLRLDYLAAMTAAQHRINEDVRSLSQTASPVSVEPTHGKATVIVPVFNTELRFIRELIFGLNNQSMRPAEVVFVDDASNAGYVERLQSVLEKELRIPYQLVRHPRNKGLAGARNSGLAAARTDYVINIDSDDVPLSNFVRDIVRRLDAEPACAAAVPYLKAFNEEDNFNLQAFGGYVYRPLGDGVLASQLDNHLGHANSGYRTSVLRALGGWDESEKSMWEDWALYLKLASSGHRIGVIPKPGCLYRVRRGSMLRTYKVWPAMRRLARNMEGLPRFENFRLQAVMRNWREQESSMQAELIRLRAEHSAMSAEMNRASVKATRSIVARLARYPRTFSVARASGAVVWRMARRVRDMAIAK